MKVIFLSTSEFSVDFSVYLLYRWPGRGSQSSQEPRPVKSHCDILWYLPSQRCVRSSGRAEVASEQGIHVRRQCALGSHSPGVHSDLALIRVWQLMAYLSVSPITCEPLRQEQSYISMSLDPGPNSTPWSAQSVIPKFINGAGYQVLTSAPSLSCWVISSLESLHFSVESSCLACCSFCPQ